MSRRDAIFIHPQVLERTAQPLGVGIAIQRKGICWRPTLTYVQSVDLLLSGSPDYEELLRHLGINDHPHAVLAVPEPTLCVKVEGCNSIVELAGFRLLN